MPELPQQLHSNEELLEVLTSPSAELVESLTHLESPLVVLGAGGKMGPSLCILAKRAAMVAGKQLEIIATSRFRDAKARKTLEDQGVMTRAVDVFDDNQLKELPDSANVVYLVGMKFGTSTDPVPTWATNTLGPILASRRFSGSRIVALSTGNVYPFSTVASGGCSESDSIGPVGEYANAAVARERLFEHFSREDNSPIVNIRLNYAHDLRYGVVSDIARKVASGQPIDLSMGHFNAIWQGDANETILRSFQLCSVPASALNLTSPEIYSVRETAFKLGELLGVTPKFVGEEQPTALLSNASRMANEFGPPRVSFERLVQWIAHWTKQGGQTLGKPTGFEARNGSF